MPSYELEDFDLELERVVPNVSVAVSSGWTAVCPLSNTVCGVGGFFGPPFAAPDASLTVAFDLDDHVLIDHAHPELADHILVQGGQWHADRVTRAGTYHRYQNGRLTSFRVGSELVPCRERTGYVLSVTVENRGTEPLNLRLRAMFEPGGLRRLAGNEWHYDTPLPGRRARQLSPWQWGNDEAVASLTSDLASRPVAPGERQVSYLAVTLDRQPGPLSTPELPTLAAPTRAWWRKTLAERLASVPTLHSDVEGLEEYYRRSLMSGLVCLWDSPAFPTSPFVTTGGLDGGNMCAYIWDICGYAPNLVTMMLGADTHRLVDVLAGIDYNKHYAVTLDGTGVGVAYAYSAWSMISLIRCLSAHHGIGSPLVGRALEIVEDGHARYAAAGDLLDFGDQENLLEMRTAGWEHVVASPNAERAWCLATIAELAEIYRSPLDREDLRRRAARIRDAVRRELWDDRAGWFRCRYPDGHCELIYSVQVFDAVRSGCCSAEMTEAIFSHIRDGAFLGRYGASSVSGEDDVHYEIGDPDWSGSGAYEGEATTLALTLWEQRRGELAWDVLRRLLWMGEQLPYFPQEHYCHRPDAPRHKRMNVIAGLAGAEAIVFGLMGLVAKPDGSLWFDPQRSVNGTIELRDFRFRQRVIDVDLAPERCRVSVDGRCLHDGPLQLVPLVSSRAPG